jgi:hypothetical protein
VRSGSPRLGWFDSCAVPSAGLDGVFESLCVRTLRKTFAPCEKPERDYIGWRSRKEFYAAGCSSPSRAEGCGDAHWVRMTRGAGAAPRRSRPIALATLAALGIGALGLASSVALAGHASPLQVTTGETITGTTTTTATTTGPSTTTTSPAPDRKPPPPPKPDPRPKKRTRAKPPPPPPAPQPAAPRSTTTPAAAAPPARRPPPPTPRVAVPRRNPVARAAPQKPTRSRQRSTARVRRSERTAPRAKVAPRERAKFQADAEAGEAFGPTAAPTPRFSKTETPVSSGLIVFLTLFALGGLLLLGASAVPPSRIPWQVISEPLYVHRSNLAAIGLGTIAIALACLNFAVLL